jgi:hypothetical protein
MVLGAIAVIALLAAVATALVRWSSARGDAE